jgi:hypothetical protein
LVFSWFFAWEKKKGPHVHRRFFQSTILTHSGKE